MVALDKMRNKIKNLIETEKRKAFSPDYADKATDEETLGIIISQYFEWGGIPILKTAYSALEDANFHTEADMILQIIDNLEHPNPHKIKHLD